MLRTHLTLLAAAAALAGCAADDGTAPGPTTAREQLAQGTMVLFDSDGSTAHFAATVHLGETAVGAVAVDLPVEGGVVVVGLDEHDDILLDELTVTLGDAWMAMDDVFDDGMLVRHFVLTMRRPVVLAGTLWGDGDDIAMATDSAQLVELEWGVARGKGFDDEGLDELEATTAVDLDVMVLPSRDQVEVLVFVETRSFLWSWNGLSIRSRLEITLDGLVERDH